MRLVCNGGRVEVIVLQISYREARDLIPTITMAPANPHLSQATMLVETRQLAWCVANRIVYQLLYLFEVLSTF